MQIANGIVPCICTSCTQDARYSLRTTTPPLSFTALEVQTAADEAFETRDFPTMPWVLLRIMGAQITVYLQGTRLGHVKQSTH